MERAQRAAGASKRAREREQRAAGAGKSATEREQRAAGAGKSAMERAQRAAGASKRARERARRAAGAGKSATERWQRLADAAYQSWKEGNFQRYEKMVRRAFAVAERFQQGDERLTHSLLSLGNLLLWQNRIEEAGPLLLSGLNSARLGSSPNSDYMMRALVAAGNYYLALEDFRSAQKYFLEAHQRCRTKKRLMKALAGGCCDGLYRLNFNRASAQMSRRRYATAYTYFQRALSVLHESVDQQQLRTIRALSGMAACAQRSKQLEMALPVLRRLLNLCESSGEATADDIKYIAGILHQLKKQALESKGNASAIKTLENLDAKLRKAAQNALHTARPASARRLRISEKHHGIAVADPYRWLEKLDSEEVEKWISAQSEYTALYLSSLPGRGEITSMLLRNYSSPSYSVPVKAGSHYYYKVYGRNQPQTALFRRARMSGKGKMVVDPKLLIDSDDQWITNYFLSGNGRYMAFGVSEYGSDWQFWRIYDLKRERLLNERIDGLKDDYVIWSNDGKGFFYVKFKTPRGASLRTAVSRMPAVYYHRIGTRQEDDILVYERPDKPHWYLGLGSSSDGKWLIIGAWHNKNAHNRIFVKPTSSLSAKAIPLFPDADARYIFVDAVGDELLFVTDKDAPLRRLISVSIRGMREKELIAQSTDVLLAAAVAGNKILAHYLKKQHSRLSEFSLKGEFLRHIALPFAGTVTEISAAPQVKEAFIALTSFTDPPGIYVRHATSAKVQAVLKPRFAAARSRYTTKSAYFTSPDGTKVPIFVVCQKDLPRDGNNPTLLYGYGGFAVNMTPSYSYDVMTWIEMGGVYAVPALRGGGELGSDWHRNGTGVLKQNTFEDFIAAAEWLIQQGYTQPDKLAIMGASNGGLTVGAAITRRPDLFKAAIIINGLLDMLRFHRSTLAWTWHAEFGTPKNKSDFSVLYAYSPLHRVSHRHAYPATLILAGEMDDRVVPWHSYKFAAALQHAQNGANPVLLRVERKEGHGSIRPSDRVADQLLFLMQALGMRSPSASGAKNRRSSRANPGVSRQARRATPHRPARAAK
ncbi:MAG TPA: prolyl oligopeptidase family serine peptidase [Candidatus Obscuribacterales bacterium]